jgi:hypothetical protein
MRWHTPEYRAYLRCHSRTVPCLLRLSCRIEGQERHLRAVVGTLDVEPSPGPYPGKTRLLGQLFMPSAKSMILIVGATETVPDMTPAALPGLLFTKLYPPAVREQTIARDRLLDRLRRPWGPRLTVVAAPAGYGKTTLLGTWRDTESAQRPVAWLSLDEGDHDPIVLWSHALEALRPCVNRTGVVLHRTR